MEWTDGTYTISNDHALLSAKKIKDLLSKSYWADNRSLEIIEKSIHHSICYGVYYKDEQIGFGRIITDHATTYYLCDVILEEAHRGKGLGKKLIECMHQFEDFSDCYGILATRDAHGLYRHYGFVNAEKSFMHRIPK